MKNFLVSFLIIISSFFVFLWGCTNNTHFIPQIDKKLIEFSNDKVINDSIQYHPVRLTKEGKILPWYSANLGQSFDTIVKLTWNFWDKMEIDSNGIKYYMNHQVWRPKHDQRGLGGDQFCMALSSWDLFYNYTGNQAVLDNMRYIADYYLLHSLSDSSCIWPNLPYPYNCKIHSGEYTGDMILQEGFLQPDKAGSFGWELVKLYKKTGENKYLNAAVKIANTLATKVRKGDNEHSPWPFKVHAVTGEVGIHQKNDYTQSDIKSEYTSNFTGTLEMFNALISLKFGDMTGYQKAVDLTLEWLKDFPAKTNKWGPFFEDIPGWSDTQINAVTYAMFLMDHPEYDSNWRQTVKNIFEWVHKTLGNKEFEKYGVLCTNEQTIYRVPGNSHSSRQASMEIRYWSLTGDDAYLDNAIKELSWATYMVDWDGKNFYMRDDIWMTDGYGDYIRHYLRAMAAAPQLAPDNSNHLLKSTSIVKSIDYQKNKIIYKTFDKHSEELFRLQYKPEKIMAGDIQLKQLTNEAGDGWMWQSLSKGGILKVKHSSGDKVILNFL